MVNGTTTDPHSTPQRGTDIRLTSLDWLALLLIIIGGINWGLIGALQFDVVAWLLGPMSAPSRVVYVLAGLGALYCVVIAPRWRHER